jgi:hypothetical protein
MLGTTGGELTASQAAHSNSIAKTIQHQPSTGAEGYDCQEQHFYTDEFQGGT